ncbi:MAG: DUF5686 family protein, partial [Cyclobacteriaceae bacterium]
PKTNGIGEIELKVSYTKLDKANKWVPFSVDFYIDAVNGIDAFYHAVQYDFNFDLQNEDQPPAGLRYQIADDARSKGPYYWESNRPIPLTDEEALTYKNDTLFTSAFDLDTEVAPSVTDSTGISGKDRSLLWYGIFNDRTYKLSDQWQLTTDSYISHINFNTVEGLVVGQRSTFQYEPANNKLLTITPEIRYGFSSKKFFGKVDLEKVLNPVKPAKLSVSGGSYPEQISGFESISPFDNTMYSLLDGQNYLKLYQNDFIDMRFQKELFNGFDLRISTGYAYRSSLSNTTDFSFANEEELNYTPNIARVDNLLLNFTDNAIWKYGISINYAIARPYNLYPDRKEILPTNRPVIRVAYESGRVDSDYQLLWGNVSDAWTFGIVGTSSLSVSYGNFLSRNNVFVTEYFHFAGNQTVFLNNAGNYNLTYQLLDYYHMSSDREFFGATYEHDFNSAIIGKIPLLNKTKASLSLNANYLETPAVGNYFEAGIQLKHILQVINIGYYQSYQNGEYIRNGFVIGAAVTIE